MKSRTPLSLQSLRWCLAAVLGACLSASCLTAAETNAPAAETKAPAAETKESATDAKAPPAENTETNAPEAKVKSLTPEEFFEGGKSTANNWIDLTAGGFIYGGNKAQLQQRQRDNRSGFGGIEDFHYQKSLDKTTTLTMDGRALFDEHDYKLSLGLVREGTGYVKFGFNQFRTWSSGDGGFYPPAGLWYPVSDNALALDRGEISFEAGLRMDKVPKITFKYTHSYRDGEKASTIWGVAHPAVGATRALSPSFYDISEYNDSFQLDASHKIKATEFGVGLRYDTGKINDALKTIQSLGEPSQQAITDRQGTTYDMFNVHAFTETWFKPTLMLSSGFSYSDLDNTDLSGSRIYGSDFDVNYVPYAQAGVGYYGLNGFSRLHEYVMNLNLFTRPWKSFTIVPSIRVQKEDTDATVAGFETLGANPAALFNSLSDRSVLDVRERLDLTYTGVTNWVFDARGEWTEGDGNLYELGGLAPIGGIGVPSIQRQTDDQRLFQKYSLNARWYPVRKLSLNFGGYYKHNQYDYNNNLDSTANDPTSANRYPAYLVMQEFETYDANMGATLRLRQNLTLNGRYEYQWSTIHTKPDPISGLTEAESARMESQIIGMNLSWTPWSRLYLQPGLSYVLSKTKTPVSDFTPTGLSAAPILAAQNNYWTLNFNSGLVVDDKTDFNVGYFYYRADNYNDNSTVGVPYGADAEEHGVTASVVRKLSENVSLTVKYGYSRFTDKTAGYNDNYEAHLVLATLRYRF